MTFSVQNLIIYHKTKLVVQEERRNDRKKPTASTKLANCNLRRVLINKFLPLDATISHVKLVFNEIRQNLHFFLGQIFKISKCPQMPQPKSSVKLINLFSKCKSNSNLE